MRLSVYGFGRRPFVGHAVGHAEDGARGGAEIEVRGGPSVGAAVGPECVESLRGAEGSPHVGVVVDAVRSKRLRADPAPALVETAPYDDFAACGYDMAAVKAKGLQRTEGKEYVVQDGDIIEFLFNV